MMETAEVSCFIVDEGLRLGADEIASITTHGIFRQVRFANNEITVTKTWDQTGASILFKKNKRILVASITDVSKNGIRNALKDLAHTVKIMKPHKSYASLPEGPFKYETIPGLYDERIPRLEEKNIDYVEAAINSAIENGAKRVAGTLLTSDTQSSLKTSKNAKGTLRKTTINMVVRSLANGESSGMGITCGTTLKDFNPEKAGEEAGRLAKMSVDAVSGKSQKYDVVLSRAASAILFDIFAGMDSAFYVDSGQSCLADKLGEKIAFEGLSVYDDAKAAEGLGSTPFDDEGYPTGKTVIIENGRLRAYLHNSVTSKKYKTKSTANAGWIAPHAWNIIVKEGKLAEDELLKEVKEGLYVNNITYVRFQDYRKGDFSAIIRDGVFKIENGAITRAVKGLRLSDNIIRMFQNITNLSRESRQVSHWWMEWGTPSVKTPLILSRDVGFTVPTK